MKGRITPAIGLFFAAPLVAEFLLGNLPIKLLPALIVLAPLYGGGAVLIREMVRRTGRGWASILTLGVAYGILEEAYTTQSLFNADYLHLKLGLLAPAYIPALGIGAWWTLWMFNVHAVWSIATPIALIEAAVPNCARSRTFREMPERDGRGVDDGQRRGADAREARQAVREVSTSATSLPSLRALSL